MTEKSKRMERLKMLGDIVRGGTKPPVAGSANCSALFKAAAFMDWHQVVLNSGPPCFHLSDDGRFCGRAERWDGHKRIGGSEAIHKFVSLEALLRSLAPNDDLSRSGDNPGR